MASGTRSFLLSLPRSSVFLLKLNRLKKIYFCIVIFPIEETLNLNDALFICVIYSMETIEPNTLGFMILFSSDAIERKLCNPRVFKRVGNT